VQQDEGRLLRAILRSGIDAEGGAAGIGQNRARKAGWPGQIRAA